MKKFLLFFLLTQSIIAQTWLIPKPNTTFPANQSVLFQTTNLFLNSFFLGGTNGSNGYFIWNGQRYDSPSDLAVAVSNSVAPTSLVFLVDFVTYTNYVNTELYSISNRLGIEINSRIAADAAFSNALTFVPTNASIVYVNSSSNFISWSYSGSNKTWFFTVCLTNGQGAGGGFGGTNIINVTNNNSFSVGTLSTIVSNYFAPSNIIVAGTTYITNFFTISNSTTVGGVTITNLNQNTINNTVNNTNIITVGSTSISNSFIITNNLTVGSVNVTNFNYITNLVNNTINNTNNITVGSTSISNNFNITNNINVGSVILTNININTNTVTTTVNPSYNLTFAPTNNNTITLVSTNINSTIVTNILSTTNFNYVTNINTIIVTNLAFTNFTSVTNINQINSTNSITTSITVTNVNLITSTNDINTSVVVTNVNFVNSTNEISVTNINSAIVTNINNLSYTNDVLVTVTNINQINSTNEISTSVTVTNVNLITSTNDINTSVVVTNINFINSTNEISVTSTNIADITVTNNVVVTNINTASATVTNILTITNINTASVTVTNDLTVTNVNSASVTVTNDLTITNINTASVIVTNEVIATTQLTAQVSAVITNIINNNNFITNVFDYSTNSYITQYTLNLTGRTFSSAGRYIITNTFSATNAISTTWEFPTNASALDLMLYYGTTNSLPKAATFSLFIYANSNKTADSLVYYNDSLRLYGIRTQTNLVSSNNVVFSEDTSEISPNQTIILDNGTNTEFSLTRSVAGRALQFYNFANLGSQPYIAIEYSNKLYIAGSSSGSSQLYEWNGTTLRGIGIANPQSAILAMTIWSNRLMLACGSQNVAGGLYEYRSDIDAIVAIASAPIANQGLQDLAVYSNELYATYYVNAARYKYIPASNVFQLVHTAGGGNLSALHDGMRVFNGKLYGGIYNGVISYDGTTWSTSLLAAATIMDHLEIAPEGLHAKGSGNTAGWFLGNTSNAWVSFGTYINTVQKMHYWNGYMWWNSATFVYRAPTPFLGSSIATVFVLPNNSRYLLYDYANEIYVNDNTPPVPLYKAYGEGGVYLYQTPSNRYNASSSIRNAKRIALPPTYSENKKLYIELSTVNAITDDIISDIDVIY